MQKTLTNVAVTINLGFNIPTDWSEEEKQIAIERIQRSIANNFANPEREPKRYSTQLIAVSAHCDYLDRSHLEGLAHHFRNDNEEAEHKPETFSPMEPPEMY